MHAVHPPRHEGVWTGSKESCQDAGMPVNRQETHDGVQESTGMHEYTSIGRTGECIEDSQAPESAQRTVDHVLHEGLVNMVRGCFVRYSTHPTLSSGPIGPPEGTNPNKILQWETAMSASIEYSNVHL